jgi:hypothetical protein
MVLDYLVNHVWSGIALWIALFISDYALTLRSARLVSKGAGKHFVFPQGIELTLAFREDINALRPFSMKLAFALVLNAGLLGIFWALTKVFAWPEAFEVVLGTYVLSQIPVHVRHVKNLATFHYAAASRGLKGRIVLSRWLSLRVSAADLAAFGLLFLFLAALTERWFFVGGAWVNLTGAVNHWRMSKRESPEIADEPAAPETVRSEPEAPVPAAGSISADQR